MSEPTIVDEEEVRRWFAEGRTYQFMVDAYERQYGVLVPPSLFGEYRRRHGLVRSGGDDWLDAAGIDLTT